MKCAHDIANIWKKYWEKFNKEILENYSKKIKKKTWVFP